MKKTQNIFVLTGRKQDVNVVLEQIQFKGVTILPEDTLSIQAVVKVFANNKSVICTKNLYCFDSPISIQIVNDEILIPYDNIINISLGDIAKQFENIALKHNCDIGDHKSNSSGLSDSPKSCDCSYCKYLIHQSDYNYRTVYESKNFFVIPTLGQFIPGYLLIIPHQHVMSNAELDDITRQELLDVMEDIKYILKLTYGCSKVLVWENGTGNSGRGKAKDSVVHAHTHIAPSYLTPLDIKKMSGFKFQEISTKELSAFNQHSYLLIKDTNDKWLINNDSNVYIPRQYIRQLLANEYKIPGEQWNWREYPFKDQIYQTCSDILTCLAENWDKLPERIKSNTKKYVKKF